MRTIHAAIFFLLGGLLILASCGSGEVRTENAIRQAIASGQFDKAERMLRTDGRELSQAARARIAKERDGYEKGYKKAEDWLVSALQSTSKDIVYSDGREYLDHVRDPYYQRALLHELRYRLDYWVKEAKRRPIRKREPESELAKPVETTKPPEIEEQVSQADENLLGGAGTDVLLIEAAKLEKEGDFASAMQLLKDNLAFAGTRSKEMRDLLWSVEDRCQKEVDRLIAEADRMAESGKLREAVGFLAKNAERFPDVGPLAGLAHHRAELSLRLRAGERPRGESSSSYPSARVAKKSRATPHASSIDPEILLSNALLDGDERRFKDASEKFDRLALLYRGRDPRLVFLYQTEAEEARLLATAKAALLSKIEKSPDKFRRVPIGRGATGKILAHEGDTLLVEGPLGKARSPLASFSNSELLSLFKIAVREPREILALAVLWFREKKADKAEAQLRRALKKDALLKGIVNGLLAKARREVLEEGGYVLDGKDFVSVAVMKRRKLERDAAKIVDFACTRRSQDARDGAFAAIYKLDESVLPFVSKRLRKRRAELLKKLEKMPMRASLKKLQNLRRELDKRRHYALELIYDTKKYFYPYKPPAVSPEKAKLYPAVQLEVDRRVAKVREIWDGKGLTLTVAASVRGKIQLFQWIAEKLTDIDDDFVAKDNEADLLLLQQGMTVRNVALDGRDRRYLDYWAEVDSYNEEKLGEWIQKKLISRAQAEVVRHTNAYREMMGHHPLKADLRLMKSTQGHCEEMSKLGYFSHYSPTKGRKTPYERMRLEGYPNGVGENLAINSSAPGSVTAWKHSSGHHRNMLSKAHGDIGTGAVGRYYGQNFGAGRSVRRGR